MRAPRLPRTARHACALTLALGLLLVPLLATASVARTVNLSGNIDFSVETFAAQGRFLLLWIAPSFGLRDGHVELAQTLAGQGIEVWHADFSTELFLPRGSTGMRAIDPRQVAELVRAAHRLTGKQVALVSDSYGAIPVLYGARQWQASKPESPYLVGAILFSPNLYAGVPALGTDPEYLPIARATNLPVLIFQGEANGNRWQLGALVQRLQGGGSTVYVAAMRGVTGLFYDAERDLPAQAYFERLPRRLKHMLPLLAKTPTPLAALPLAQTPVASPKRVDTELKPFRADPVPRPIALTDAGGQQVVVDQYRDQVTLVNFWASWCPPCVEEIPSLNRLRQLLQDQPFRLISVNYAEPPETIRAFLKQVEVDFPVLLDTDGEVSANWKVLVYPSTFVIGPDGRIHYGVNAAIAWDDPQVVARLRALMARPRR